MKSLFDTIAILGIAFAILCGSSSQSTAQGVSTITSGSTEYVVRIRNNSGEPAMISIRYWNGRPKDGWRQSNWQTVTPGRYFELKLKDQTVWEDPKGRDRIWAITVKEFLPNRQLLRDFADWRQLEWKVKRTTQSGQYGWVDTYTLELAATPIIASTPIGQPINATLRNLTTRTVRVTDRGKAWDLAPNQQLIWQLRGESSYEVSYVCKCSKSHPIQLGLKEVRLIERDGATHTLYE